MPPASPERANRGAHLVRYRDARTNCANVPTHLAVNFENSVGDERIRTVTERPGQHKREDGTAAQAEASAVKKNERPPTKGVKSSGPQGRRVRDLFRGATESTGQLDHSLGCRHLGPASAHVSVPPVWSGQLPHRFPVRLIAPRLIALAGRFGGSALTRSYGHAVGPHVKIGRSVTQNRRSLKRAHAPSATPG
jgi:hypothetical protein